MSDAEATSAKKSPSKKPLTEEQKAAAKARREQVLWSKTVDNSAININGATHSKMINRTRGLVSNYIKEGKTDDEISDLLAKRHPDASTEPLTCANFIINDFIVRVHQSQTKKEEAPAKDKKDSSDKRKKAPAHSSDDEPVSSKHAKSDKAAAAPADKKKTKSKLVN